MHDQGEPQSAASTEAIVPPSGLLESFLPRDRRAALAGIGGVPHRVRGSALFADISGFTPLTEALVAEHGPQPEGQEVGDPAEGGFCVGSWTPSCLLRF